jgi:hypothetical protein
VRLERVEPQARAVHRGSVMNAIVRSQVNLASSNDEPSAVSERTTLVPSSVTLARSPTTPPGDDLTLDTTQIVPALVLSELRYQARVRADDVVATVPADDVVVRRALVAAHVLPSRRDLDVTQDDLDSTQYRHRAARAMRHAIVVGIIAIGLLSVVLIALVD